ncbi:MAG: HD domain-containing protein [Bacilli bacterium]|nr:HD domain-containing protein [Bacilli bacterium]
MTWIKELKDGDKVATELLVSGVTKGVTDKGLVYLNITLQDKSGNIEGKKWDASETDIKTITVGSVVYVEGNVNVYKGNNQLKINNIEVINDISTLDLNRFQKVSPIPFETLKAKLDAFLDSFTDKDVELVTKTVLEHFYNKYISYPAAVRIHHEFAHGILHHSVTMAELADQVAKIYPQVDRDILVAGALLHDVGKTIEYEKPLTPSVTVEGKLCGHISIMYAEFKKIVDDLHIESEVPLLLEHMILSHHGTLEFGSPVLPSTREALLLSEIDMLDSRMMILDKAYDGVEPGSFTQRVWALDDVSFYKAKKR